MTENHVIFVGGKPFMNYVTAVVMQFTTQNAQNVTVRSRGKFISRAVDVAEVVKSRFLKNQVEVSNILTGSEEFENKEGRKVRVSTIDIVLAATANGVAGSEPAKEVVEEKAEEPAKEATEELVAEEKAEEAPAETTEEKAE